VRRLRIRSREHGGVGIAIGALHANINEGPERVYRGRERHGAHRGGTSCHGRTSVGRDGVRVLRVWLHRQVPQAEGCSSDASTVYALSVYDGVRKTRVTLRLRYSPGCQSEWATVTDTNRPDGAIFWIYDRGTHALEVATTERATFTRQWQTTKMVGVAETKAQACVEVRNPHGMSAPLCTPFIGH